MTNFTICLAEALADVKITHDGPVVVGGTITFKAELLNSDGTHPSGKFAYKWKDDALIPHQHKVDLNYYVYFVFFFLEFFPSTSS